MIRLSSAVFGLVHMCVCYVRMALNEARRLKLDSSLAVVGLPCASFSIMWLECTTCFGMLQLLLHVSLLSVLYPNSGRGTRQDATLSTLVAMMATGLFMLATPFLQELCC